MNRTFRHWITNDTKKPFYARKVFELTGKVQKSTIRICGLGQFVLYINGKKVGDRVLDPAWTDYKKLVNYITFDITDLLQKGKNVIAAEVGNGWYLMDEEGGYSFHFPAFMPPNPNPYQPAGESLVLAAHVEITTEDQELILDADESWRVMESAVRIANVYGSEMVDGRCTVDGWNQTAFDDSAWKLASIVEEKKEPKGILEEQTVPGIRVIKTYEGVYLHTYQGRAVYDFGQNTSGMLEFQVKGHVGDTVRVFPAEKLGPEGSVDQVAKNWMDINVCDTYIIGHDDTWETYEMKFTYIGARYIAVEWETAEGNAAGEIREVKLHAITSATERSGEFSCDDDRFLKIYDMVEKSVEANMLSVHTDCPTIERFAWQEENHLMAPSVMYMKNVKKHWEKFLEDTRIAQHTAWDYFYDFEGNKIYPGEGLIPAQAPCYIPNVLPVPGMGSFYDIIGWGSSIIIGTYWHYLFYGDVQIVKDNYDAGKRYLNYLKTKVNEEGFINHGLGDWGNPNQEYARENIETAFLYADAKLMGEFAEILDKQMDVEQKYTGRATIYQQNQEEFLAYAAQVKENYNKKLLVFDKAQNRYCYRVWEKEGISMTQAAEAIPLFWGMVPEDKEQDVAAALYETMISAGSFQCGEVGQPYIIQTLSKYGWNELIAEFIVKEQHPSYYAFVLDGETSLGEYWETNPRSHNHDMMGHIVEWYYNGLAGIQPLEPGFKKVLIKPYLPKSMNKMQATYQSASGAITVSLTRTEGKVEAEIHAADGIEVVTELS